jgi:hypothetical protein
LHICFPAASMDNLSIEGDPDSVRSFVNISYHGMALESFGEEPDDGRSEEGPLRAPGHPPRSRRLPLASVRPFGFASAQGSLAPDKGKGKAGTQIDFSNNSPTMFSRNTQKPHYFIFSESANSAWPAPPPVPPYQLFCQQPQIPPNQPCLPHGATPTIQPSSLMLPNNMTWQLHRGLFAQDQQHHSAPSQLYSTPNPGPTASTSSSASSQYGIMQIVSTPSQNSAQLQTSAQTHNYNLKSSIPNLTFEHSSSQTRPSLFGSSNHSAPPNEAQPEGYLPQPRYTICR